MNKKRSSFILCWLLHVATLFAQEKSATTISPLLPQFLREGDRPQLGFSVKNNAKQDYTGTASLFLVDEANQPIDGWFFNSVANQYFTIDPESLSTIYFPIEVPFAFKHKTNWKLQVLSGPDTVSLQGTIPVFPWVYEEASQAEPLRTSAMTIEKKCWKIVTERNSVSREPLEEFTSLHLGDKVAIQLIISVKQPVNLLQLKDSWAAGLMPAKKARIVSAAGLQQKSVTKIQFSCLDNNEKHEKKMELRNIAPGIYTVEYLATAICTGTYHQPPAMIFANTNAKESARSSVSKINIE